MNQPIDLGGISPSAKSLEELNGLRTVTLAVYVLQALSLFFGVSALVAIIINYVKRDDVAGTVYQSHFDWQIRTFWWGLLWLCVGAVLAILMVGFIVLFGVWLWFVYRVVKGFLKLTEGKPVFPA
ncbi:MAG: DUF4870 family protein [Rubrivivax sp.]|jgi:uncharacterized membrane protein